MTAKAILTTMPPNKYKRLITHIVNTLSDSLNHHIGWNTTRQRFDNVRIVISEKSNWRLRATILKPLFLREEFPAARYGIYRAVFSKEAERGLGGTLSFTCQAYLCSNIPEISRTIVAATSQAIHVYFIGCDGWLAPFPRYCIRPFRARYNKRDAWRPLIAMQSLRSLALCCWPRLQFINLLPISRKADQGFLC